MASVCFTEEQRRQAALKKFCKDYMNKLCSVRGKSRKTKAQFCKAIGISPVTFWRWDTQGELPSAEFGKVVLAAMRAGLVIRVEEAAEQ